MRSKKQTYIRPCKKCGRLFKPKGKYTYLCPECNPQYGQQSPRYSRRGKSRVPYQ